MTREGQKEVSEGVICYLEMTVQKWMLMACQFALCFRKEKNKGSFDLFLVMHDNRTQMCLCICQLSNEAYVQIRKARPRFIQN